MNRIKWYLCSGLIAIIVVLCFASRTSPMYSLLLGDYGGNAAAEAMVIGKYWIQGEVPYKDLYAIGGPLYFAIQAAGWALGGRNGIFILEIMSLWCSLLYMQKTAMMFCTEKKSKICVIVMVIPYIALCSGGNSAAEWCLPLLAIGMFLGIRSLYREDLSVKIIFTIGLLAGLLILIHLRSGGILYGLIGCFIWHIFREKRWKYFIILFGGMTIPLVIVSAYFAWNGIFNIMLDAAITYPIQMLGEGFETKKVIVHKLIKSMLMLPLAIAAVKMFSLKEKKLGSTLIMVFSCTFLLLISGDNCWYYYLAALPAISVAAAIFAENRDVRKNFALAITILIIAGISIIPLKNYSKYLRKGVPSVIVEFYEDICAYQEANESCYLLAVDTDCSYYLVLDERPVYAYFSNQTELIKYLPEVEQQLNDFMEDEVQADIVLTTEKGWVGREYKNYTLVQVYCKVGGNLCVYLPECV